MISLPDAGHAETGNDIHKALRLLCDHRDPILGGGRDQRDQIHAVLAADGLELVFFLKGHVGQDEPVDPDIRGRRR